ncbi:MAG TPA: formylmethanofuran dehydrogenase [Burkholderiaceae bacterium]|nr:formylmethanofuran dehydrogenase [Burkholderiaceae bacterium]
MSEPASPSAVAARSARSAWTCPFCALLCDDLAIAHADAAASSANPCPRSAASVSRLAATPAAASALIDGRSATLDAALDAAANRVAAWCQPLLAGLATDIAGARAVFRLAARIGAICDHADGASLMHGLRALQDRGQYIATLAEVRSRAELVVCVGTPAVARFPLFFRRIGIGEPGSPCQRLVFLGSAAPVDLPPSLAVDVVPGSGDPLADLQQLNALAARQWLREADASLRQLADRLRDSRYSALVWEAATLPAQGALVVEALNRLVGTLNRSTRAATIGLGGSDGGHSVNQTLAWLSGLPLRTRFASEGLQHEPHRFDAARLLAQGAVDGLVWISSFDPQRLPPATERPLVVLGPPAMAARVRSDDCVFIPVATPGLNAAGHLFRTDGPVVVPVFAVRDDALSGVAQVIDGITHRLARAP